MSIIVRLGAHVARHHHRYYLATIAALVAALALGFAGGFGGHDRIVQLMGEHGPVQPPIAAASRAGVGTPQRHVGGYTWTGQHVAARPLYGGTLPAAVDLSQWNPSVGDQGNVNSCVSWAIGYYLRTWYLKRDGIEPSGGMAPMYLYSQVTGGQNVDTSFVGTLDVLERTGIAPERAYAQGYDNYWQLPTSAERAAAAPYAISGYRTLFSGAGQGYAAQDAIEASIAAGTPVVLGIPVYGNFYNAGPSSYYVDGASGSYYGGHGVFASKYDANGVWIENQWGTGWGLGGWVELSWSFVRSYVFEADVMSVSERPAPTPTPKPTARPTATPTPRPTPRPTPTPKPSVKATVIRSMRVAQWLRAKPQTNSTREIDVPKGTVITPVAPPTPHWLPIRYRGKGGWILASNTQVQYVVTLTGVRARNGVVRIGT